LRGSRRNATDGVALVNSRDVAEAFEKRPSEVNRAINDFEIGAELHRSWFREARVLDAYGREQPSFDMTRQGFTLLVMGWTGERAMAFKVRYIEAFDAMEAAPAAERQWAGRSVEERRWRDQGNLGPAAYAAKEMRR